MPDAASNQLQTFVLGLDRLVSGLHLVLLCNGKQAVRPSPSNELYCNLHQCHPLSNIPVIYGIVSFLINWPEYVNQRMQLDFLV